MPSVSDSVPSVSSVVSKVSGDSIFADSSNDSVRASSDSASGDCVRSANDVIAGDGKAVNSLCDSLSDNMSVSSSGVESRGNSTTVSKLNPF